MKMLKRLFTVGVLFVLVNAARAATHTLTLNTNGNGSVARNPTNAFYPEGAVVTITALPASGWSFNSWSGDASGSVNPLNVTMDADKVITANFLPIPSYTLTVNVTGSGSVAPSSGTFASNTVVSLTATPSAGWAFHHWSGDATGSANPVDVTMNSAKVVGATFIQPLQITNQPVGGSVSVGGTISLTVGAQGSGPISYQWLFSGGPISSPDSPTLTLSNLNSGQAGDYRVVVSNPYQSVTSSVATVSVECAGTNIVTTATDAALRAAVAIGGNVRFCFNGTIVLTSTIPVMANTTLDASGMAVAIDGGNAVRLFDVSTNVVFGLTNLTLVRGRAIGASGGGAILSRGGAVTLEACRVIQNTGRDVNGGALACSGGSLLVHASQFATNSVAGSLGSSVQGGAVFAQGALVQITDSLFHSNSLASDFTTGSSSTAQLSGGALAFGPGTITVLARTRFLTNAVLGGFTRLGAVPGVGGGAIYDRGSSFRVEQCLFMGNVAQGSGGGPAEYTTISAFGGALRSTGPAHLNGCAFIGNRSRGGGGFEPTANYGTPGRPAAGGAVVAGTLFATNCTFALNAVLGGNGGTPGAWAGDAYGGAIHFEGGATVLMNVTIASNLANVPRPLGTSGGGLSGGMNLAVATNASVTVRNSLLAGASNSVWGTLTDGGFNMCSDGTASFSSGSSFNFTDPKLLPLADNGGPTLTMALAANSPAIDWAPAAGAPATDQRGVARPSSGANVVDLGAYEFVPAPPTLGAARSGGSLNVSFVGSSGKTYRLERCTNFSDWELHELIGPLPTNGPVTRTIPAALHCQFFRLRWGP